MKLRLLVCARTLSSHAAACGKPWEMPDVKFSAKNLTAEDKRFVLGEVSRFGGSLPIERALMPPSTWYLTDAFAKAEAAAVFTPTWQLACRSTQVSAPGQFVATYVGPGEPVLIVRGKDNVLRAFSNVCRHHAARVAEGTGDATQFTCPYHAWTYDLKGQLIKFTKMRGTKDFDAVDVRLPELDVEEWGPLVFVKPRTGDSHTVAEALAPVTAEFDAMDETVSNQQRWSEGGWKRLHFLRRRVYDIKCNWKVYCDNYLDGGYHIPHLHLGLNSELEMQSYRTLLFDRVSLQKCKSKSKRVGSDASYVFMYPNLAINRYGEWLDTNLVLPVAPDRCVIVFDWFHTDSTPAGRLELQEQLDSSRAIQDEDVTISESVQCGIGSSSYEAGRYSPTVEIAEYHFHRLLAQSFAKYLV